VQRLTIVVAFQYCLLATWGVDEFFAKALAIFFNWIKKILLWQIITKKSGMCSSGKARIK
jgi:hypothetical protein